jgi:hypothetical protein
VYGLQWERGGGCEETYCRRQEKQRERAHPCKADRGLFRSPNSAWADNSASWRLGSVIDAQPSEALVVIAVVVVGVALSRLCLAIVVRRHSPNSVNNGSALF